MTNEITIRDFYGKILGYVQEDTNGNKVFRDFYRKIVARYNKASNKTTDFYGRIISKGDVGASLLYK